MVVVQSPSRVWLCNPMDCNTSGFPVPHHLPEFAQVHVYWVGDAIQPSHPLSSPSPPAFNLSQHQGIFQWAGSSQQVGKVLEFQLRHQSFNEYSGLISFRIEDSWALTSNVKIRLSGAGASLRLFGWFQYAARIENHSLEGRKSSSWVAKEMWQIESVTQCSVRPPVFCKASSWPLSPESA